MSVKSVDYHRASNAVVFGGIVTYVGGMLLLIAFCSPYWIESYDDSFSNFKNMGLWQYCFNQIRYPYFQFDKLFDGCNSIFSQEFYVIREWLLPGWLLVVQTFMTIAFLASFSSQAIIAMILVRWPLRPVLKYEWLLSGISAVCNAVASGLMFLATLIFVTQCWRRDWMMYPNFNHLSWSFGFAVVSFMIHFLGAFFMYMDARTGYRYRKESRNLVMQMQPNPQSSHHSNLHRSGYI